MVLLVLRWFYDERKGMEFFFDMTKSCAFKKLTRSKMDFY